MEFPPGYCLGPYEVTGQLGSGGMGVVVRALDTRLHREVAIKVLQVNRQMPGLRERFLREARASSALNHPNICTIFDIGESDGYPYMVMELLHGETLKNAIRRETMSVDRILHIAGEITQALMAAHAKGIVHRDIKPANIFLVPMPNGEEQAKVLDFGLAKYETRHNADHLTEGLTTVGVTVGTVAYMSPEQARGESLDARSDLFSLGVVLYEMATGTVPFHGATSALVFVELLGKNPQPVREWNRTIPERLENLILRLLEKERNNRFQSASELYNALRALDAAGRVPSTPQRLSASSHPIVQVTDPQPLGRLRSSPSRSSLPAVPVVGDPLPSGEAHRIRSASSTVHRKTSQKGAIRADREEPSPKAGRRWLYVGLGLVLFIALGSLIAYRLHRHPLAQTMLDANGSIQIIGIENKTGEPALDGVASTALEILLSQSPTLSVRGEHGLRSAIDSRGNVDAVAARHMAEQSQTTAYLTGSIEEPTPQHYKLLIEVFRVSDNQRLASEEEEVSNQQAITEALERIAQRLRTDLGEDDKSIVANNTPLAKEASETLGILSALPAAREAWDIGDYPAAAKILRETIAKAPECVLCRLNLAWLQIDAGATMEANQTLDQLKANLPQASQRARQQFAFLQQMADGDPSSAVNIARQWIEARPGDMNGRVAYASALRVQGRFHEAEEAARQALTFDPNNHRAASEAERNMLALNRFESIIQVEDRNALTGSQNIGIGLLAAYALDRNSVVQQNIDAVLQTSHDQVQYAVYLDNLGQISKANAAWTSAADKAATEPSIASAAGQIRLQAAFNRALLGDCRQANLFLEAAPIGPSLAPTALFYRGMTETFCGDIAGAESAAADIADRFKGQSLAQSYLLPNLRAAILLHKNQPQEAIRYLSLARGPYQMTLTSFLRSQANVAQGQSEVAIADLQSVLSNRGTSMLMNTVLYPVARRQLGRTYGISGDKLNADHAYGKLKLLWPSADPSVSMR